MLLVRLDEMKSQIRDDIGNKIIVFLIKHCHLYSAPYFALTKKTTSKQWKDFTQYCFDVYDHEKDEKILKSVKEGGK